MIILGNSSYSDLLCLLFVFLGFTLRFWVAERRFKRKNDVRSQQFKSYIHAVVILFAELILMLISFL